MTDDTAPAHTVVNAPLDGDQAAITTIAMEASGEPYEGQVAVGIVILNRVNLPYQSDGTLLGAVLHRWAFSEYWASMVHGEYEQTSVNVEQAASAAVRDYNWLCVHAPGTWAAAGKAWADAKAWWQGEPLSFAPGPAFAGITKQTVLYYNPKIVEAAPAWAVAANEDAVIFKHTFYHDTGGT